MTARVTHAMPGTAPGEERFRSTYEATMFAAALLADYPAADVRVLYVCVDCGVEHDHDDAPRECEECGVCLGADADIDTDRCDECETERYECLCPGGEELGRCYCPACGGGGRR